MVQICWSILAIHHVLSGYITIGVLTEFFLFSVFHRSQLVDHFEHNFVHYFTLATVLIFFRCFVGTCVAGLVSSMSVSPWPWLSSLAT